MPPHGTAELRNFLVPVPVATTVCVAILERDHFRALVVLDSGRWWPIVPV